MEANPQTTALPNSLNRRTFVSDSTFSKQFKLAYLALLLVARGASERSSVAQAVASDRSLAHLKREALSLVLGTVNEQDLADRLVQNALPTQKLDTRARCLFRLVTHLILRSNESVARQIGRSIREIAPHELLPSLEFFLGTLLARDPCERPALLTDAERMAIVTHHPSWWVQYCFHLFGRSTTIELLSAPARPRYLRVNPLKNRGRQNIPVEAKSLATVLVKVPSAPSVYTLNRSSPTFSKLFSRGLFQTQDLASFLAVRAGDPKPGENILELCAAPGGKTAAMAQLMKNRGRIVSVDYSRIRMNAWKREIERLGVRIAEPVIADASRLGLRESFDLVLIDPPCSGTGVFDRNPRMKWHLSPQSVERFASLQQRFLDSALPLMAEDGRILYCTCSLTIEENELVVSRFLKSHPELETRPVLEKFGSPGLGGMIDCRRFYPHRDRTAGYFVARLQRVS